MPAVAGGRAVAVHRAVVLVQGRVLQARLRALEQPRGLRHAAGDRDGTLTTRAPGPGLPPAPFSARRPEAWSSRKVCGMRPRPLEGQSGIWATQRAASLADTRPQPGPPAPSAPSLVSPLSEPPPLAEPLTPIHSAPLPSPAPLSRTEPLSPIPVPLSPTVLPLPPCPSLSPLPVRSPPSPREPRSPHPPSSLTPPAGLVPTPLPAERLPPRPHPVPPPRPRL